MTRRRLVILSSVGFFLKRKWSITAVCDNYFDNNQITIGSSAIIFWCKNSVLHSNKSKHKLKGNLRHIKNRENKKQLQKSYLLVLSAEFLDKEDDCGNALCDVAICFSRRVITSMSASF